MGFAAKSIPSALRARRFRTIANWRSICLRGTRKAMIAIPLCTSTRRADSGHWGKWMFRWTISSARACDPSSWFLFRLFLAADIPSTWGKSAMLTCGFSPMRSCLISIRRIAPSSAAKAGQIWGPSTAGLWLFTRPLRIRNCLATSPSNPCPGIRPPRPTTPRYSLRRHPNGR